MTLTDSTSNPLAPIVVGVDGSASSIEALLAADRLARALGTTVTAVTAWSWPLVPAGAMVTSTEWTPDRDARKILDIAVAQAFGDHVPASLGSDIAEGNAAEVLMNASEGSTMLVVGTRGHGGFAGLLLGSVSSACAEHASCPVLVVRALKSR